MLHCQVVSNLMGHYPCCSICSWTPLVDGCFVLVKLRRIAYDRGPCNANGAEQALCVVSHVEHQVCVSQVLDREVKQVSQILTCCIDHLVHGYEVANALHLHLGSKGRVAVMGLDVGPSVIDVVFGCRSATSLGQKGGSITHPNLQPLCCWQG